MTPPPLSSLNVSIKRINPRSHGIVLASLMLILLTLYACSFSTIQTRSERRAEQRVLLVSDPAKADAPLNRSVAANLFSIGKRDGITIDTVLGFDRLDEALLTSCSALILLDIDEDALQIWHHADIERYVEMGGGVLIADTNRATPYLWPWLDLLKRGAHPLATMLDDGSGSPSSYRLGAGRVSVQTPGALTSPAISRLLDLLIGENSFNPALATTRRAPHFNRYTRKILDDNLYEPMDLVVLPDMKVLFIERRGRMKLYDPAAGNTETVATFDVCINGNYEDGLTGLAIDPGYGVNNHWIYVYYSPSAECEIPDQYLSRFVFEDDSLHWKSEKVVLKVFVQRETCCHSGGAVKFGPDGLLYLSTGDNTSSKESDGFSPLDERPGRGPFDSQKSSGNTHDLRGKILRIKPEADGGYSIPDGNLFPADGSNGRPEIYAMGCRNPFRIAIDPQTNWLYWGDVGPDGGRPGKYGPQSFDEWNLAMSAGNFGWPYFVGDNFAYRKRDFAADEVGDFFDPQKPLNESPNNFGARELPPAKPAWVWYDYGDSQEFPLLGNGSRSAMAGPFYYSSAYPSGSATKFPDYYDGKFFAYEWTRSWVQAWTIDKVSGELLKMEPFLPGAGFSKPIDIEFGPDGAMYMLEYGRQYFVNNDDAFLTRIEFARGNRAPVAKLDLDRPAGAAPHTVKFSAAGSFDYDSEDRELIYQWLFSDGDSVQATGKEVRYTFTASGVYHPALRVLDSHGAMTEARSTVQVGNTPPQVMIKLEQNSSFYFDGSMPEYAVVITDPEDSAGEGIDSSSASVNLSWIDDDDYLTDLRLGRAELPRGSLTFAVGSKLIKGSDCFACHNEEGENIGPSYLQVAGFYTGQNPDEVVPHLARKVIDGGGGVWGDKLMAGHPQITQADAEMMVRYILSRGESNAMPLKGSFQLNAHDPVSNKGGYVIAAGYADRGAAGIGPLSSREVLILRNPQLEAELNDGSFSALESRFGDNRDSSQVGIKANGWVRFSGVDLSGIGSIDLKLVQFSGGELQLRSGGADGPLIASIQLDTYAPSDRWRRYLLNIPKTKGRHDLYFVFAADPLIAAFGERSFERDAFSLDWVKFVR